METDGDISESSRHELTTTSFESTTDNTDSTGEVNVHRLQKMRGDSGYKSLETQQSQQQSGGSATPPKPQKKQIHFALDQESLDCDDDDPIGTASAPASFERHSLRVSDGRRSSRSKLHFDRRTGKTASRKRREYRADRQIIHVYSSILDQETDSARSDQPSGDSFEEQKPSRKFSLFRLLRGGSKESKRSLSRDYSVDEKTDALFHEFMRYDPTMDPVHPVGSGGLRRGLGGRAAARHRLHRKHTEPIIDVTGVRESLVPTKRSASLGSDSSVSSLRRLSPEDSIEEEYLEMEMAEVEPEAHEGLLKACATSERRESIIHDIPIIKLPEEENTDV